MAKQKKEGLNRTGLGGLQKNLEAKESILKRIEEIQAEEATLYPVITEKRKEIEHIRQELDVYMQTLKKPFPKGGFDEKLLDDHEHAALAEYRDSLIVLGESLSTAETNMKTLGDEKNALQKTLTDFNAEMTEADVLEYQGKVAEARKYVEDIMVIIKNQVLLAEEATKVPSPLNDLKEKKEDILSEIALGKDLQKDLEEITQHIDLEEKRMVEQDQIIENASKALPGLQRKLLTAKDVLEKLKSQKNEVLLQYLRREAEQVGQEYGEAASILIDIYHRLVALDFLMVQQGGQTIGGKGFVDFTIPAFSLNAFKGLIVPNWPRELVKARTACTMENRKAAEAREKERIARLGIEL